MADMQQQQRQPALQDQRQQPQMVGAALCYCIMSWLMVAVMLWRSTLAFNPDGIAQYTVLIVGMQFLVILLPALVYLIMTGRLRQVLAPIRVRDGLSAIGLAIFGMLPVLLLNLIWVTVMIQLKLPGDAMVLPVAEGAGQTMLLAVALAMTPGLCEEFMFRGVLLGGLERSTDTKKAILLSAILFGLAHMNLQQLLVAFVLGLVIGYLYVKTRSIWPGILYHTTHNALMVLMYQGLMSTLEEAPTALASMLISVTQPAVDLDQVLSGISQTQMMLIAGAVLLIPAAISLAIYVLILRGFSRRQPLAPPPPKQPVQRMGLLTRILLIVGALPALASIVLQFFSL